MVDEDGNGTADLTLQANQDTTVLPTPPPRINFNSISGSTISANYYNVPANSQLVFVNQTNGQAITGHATQVSGTGSVTISTAGILPYGVYYLKAWDATSHAYYAQTVTFYLSDPNGDGGGDGL